MKMTAITAQRRRNLNHFNDKKHNSANSYQEVFKYIAEKHVKRTPEQIEAERQYYVSNR